jgi:hypothetical protein
MVRPIFVRARFPVTTGALRKLWREPQLKANQHVFWVGINLPLGVA